MCKKNCWLTKTPLQTACILMLIIIIPFIIFLLIMYVMGSRVRGPLGGCEEYCELLVLPRLEFDKRYDDDTGQLGDYRPTSIATETPSTSSIKPETNKTSTNDTNPKPPDPNPKPQPEKPKPGEPAGRMFMRNHKKPFEDHLCPEDVEGTLEYPYIVAILQVLYIKGDSPINVDYLCSGAIISGNWVISSSECATKNAKLEVLKDAILIRAGSSFWTKGGVLHDVKQIAQPPTQRKNIQNIATLLAFKTKYPFMNTKFIQPLHIPRHSTYQDQMEAEMFGWEGEQKLEFTLRKKNSFIQVKSVELHKDSMCTLYQRKRGVFCGLDINPIRKCDYLTGSPLVKNNHLLGINIYTSCSEGGDNVYYFIDVSYYYEWLKTITKYG